MSACNSHNARLFKRENSEGGDPKYESLPITFAKSTGIANFISHKENNAY